MLLLHTCSGALHHYYSLGTCDLYYTVQPDSHARQDTINMHMLWGMPCIQYLVPEQPAVVLHFLDVCAFLHNHEVPRKREFTTGFLAVNSIYSPLLSRLSKRVQRYFWE